MNNIKSQIDKGIIASFSLLIIAILLIFIPYDSLEGKSVGRYIIHINSYSQLGEFIGGVTAPIISIAAFILLFLTYNSQKKELEETRNLLKKQNELMELQKFETTFFNLLNSQKILVSNLGENKKGPRLFEHIYDEFKKEYNNVKEGFELKKSDTLTNIKTLLSLNNEEYELIQKNKNKELIYAKISFIKTYDRYHLYLSYYFRHLYHILKFIKAQIDYESKFTDEKLCFNKYKEYADILQANLSSYEMSLLFYNVIFFEKMKKLVQMFNFLENFSDDGLIEKDHKSFYKVKISNRKDNFKRIILRDS